MTDDLAAEGDRLHAALSGGCIAYRCPQCDRTVMAADIAAALRERDELAAEVERGVENARHAARRIGAANRELDALRVRATRDEEALHLQGEILDALRVRAETAEAANARFYFAGWSDHKAGRAYGETAPAAQAAAVEGRPS